MGFVLVVSAVVFLSSWYVWKRTVRDVRLSGPWRAVATLLIFGGSALIPVTWLLSYRFEPSQMRAWVFAAFLWMGALFYALLFTGLAELPRLWARIQSRLRARLEGTRQPDGVDPDRRLFLARAAAGGTFVATGGITLFGVRSALHELETVELSVRLPRLPPQLSGYRIVQISDLHLGPVLDDRFLEDVVQRVNALDPDLVAITGDVVDGPVSLLAPHVAPLGRLRARNGVHLVSGNHEYYSGLEEWLRHFEELGIDVLRNQRIAVGDTHPGGASFDLAGVHDWRGGSFGAAGAPDLDEALRGGDPERELVLLAHQPAQVEAAAAAGVGLQLSGHTHGGQVWPFGALTALVQPYLKGLHHHEDRTWIYVSRGTGFWGPPLRVLAPAEITSIELTA